ncbi:hypothetical protein WME90_18755 [Sorangium sp. So ce375]|uniref:hypothetical protein n=1 Tax=Sorangium sp. So ce375 TaxID=3133306 RepID=UPI003F5B7B0C
MRSRPFITLRLPRVVHPGEAFDIGLLLESAAETPVNFVRVALRHTHELVLPGDGGFEVRDLLLLSEEVAGEGRLGEGIHRYRVSFALPGDLPPTFAGAFQACRCEVRAHVSIPWWLDARESQEVLVRPRSAQRPEDEPFIDASHRGRGAFVEVSLPGRTLTPGEVLTGAVAFGGLPGRYPFGLRVALVGSGVGRVNARSGFYESCPNVFFQDVTGIAEGTEVPFRISLPSDLAPSFSLREVALEYAVEVTIEHLAGGEVVRHRVPVIVGLFEPRTGREGKRPRVGADRWRTAWARAGQRVGLSLDRGLRLRGERAGCTVKVASAAKGLRAGLGATVRFAEPWGLRLDLRLRRVLELGGLETGEDGFDRRFRVLGREAAQVLAVLGPALRCALRAFDRAEADDREAWVWSAAEASDEQALDAFLAQVDALAQALAEAGAALPPPAAMAAWLPAWRRFAEESDGRLRVGSMRLSGTLEGGRFELDTLFKGAVPARTRVSLRLDPPIEGASRPRNAAEQALAAATLEQAARLGGVTDAEPAVAVAPGAIAVAIGAPLADPSAAREVLRPMLALARQMRGERRGGPYR